MSIENCINELTAAIKELTLRLGSTQQSVEQSSTPPAPRSPSELEIPSLITPKSEPLKPSKTDATVSSSTDSKPKGKTKDAPETAPEAPSAPTKAAKVAMYEDAATVLIAKDKTARKALIKTFKEDAEKLVDLADLGDDIWTRVIEAAKDIPEKS